MRISFYVPLFACAAIAGVFGFGDILTGVMVGLVYAVLFRGVLDKPLMPIKLSLALSVMFFIIALLLGGVYETDLYNLRAERLPLFLMPIFPASVALFTFAISSLLIKFGLRKRN